MPFTVSTTVTNPDGQSVTFVNSWTYNPPPVLTSITPNQGPQSGGTTVTLTGSGFVAGMTVLFGTQPATNVQVNPNGLTATCVTPAYVP